MPTEDDNSISGVDYDDAPEPSQPSLREIAEAAYDEGSSPDDANSEANDGRVRDERGRFVSKEQTQDPGEAERKAPSPETRPEAQTRTEPAPQGSSTPGTDHWSAEDRAIFEKAPQELKDVYLRRYNEMEADYTRKSQANAAAVQTVSALTPIFQDQDIVQSLQEVGLNPVQAIHDWARMHKAAVSEDPRVRAATLYEIAERMGFDPARVFATNRPQVTQLPAHLQKDPAILFFADQASRTESELQALRSNLHQIQQVHAQQAQNANAEALRVTRSSIDNFADEKGQDGRPVRPYFDRVVHRVIEMYQSNPDRDLQKAYEEACWADPDIRQELIQSEWSRKQSVSSNARAQQAARSNVRGLTSPVSKPANEKKGNGSLRDMLEATADEVGF